MPDRIIRDEALNSDRLLGLKRNTHRLAFVACVLEADDLGNLEAGPGALWRLWRDWLALTDRAQVAEIMLALTDADLVRLYESDGKRFAHIPKFRQRLRYLKGKHPRPPEHLECKEINALVAEKSVYGRLKTDHGPSVDARREVKRSEEKRREEKRSTRGQPVDNSARTAATTQARASTLKVKGNGAQWWKTDDGIAAKAAEVGVTARAGESFADLKARLFDAIRQPQTR